MDFGFDLVEKLLALEDSALPEFSEVADGGARLEGLLLHLHEQTFIRVEIL